VEEHVIKKKMARRLEQNEQQQTQMFTFVTNQRVIKIGDHLVIAVKSKQNWPNPLKAAE
jgi:putative heme degradation protein